MAHSANSDIFDAVINLPVRSKTLTFISIKVVLNRGESVLVCIDIMYDDASMARCEKGSSQKSTW